MNKINKKKKNVSGFTLIELMITVAIIGILTAISVPAYETYVIKAQIAEGISISAYSKEKVTEAVSFNKEIDDLKATDFTEYGESGNTTVSVEIGDSGIVTVTFGNKANKKLSVIGNNTMVFTPSYTSQGNLHWVCTSTINKIYLPHTCK